MLDDEQLPELSSSEPNSVRNDDQERTLRFKGTPKVFTISLSFMFITESYIHTQHSKFWGFDKILWFFVSVLDVCHRRWLTRTRGMLETAFRRRLPAPAAAAGANHCGRAITRNSCPGATTRCSSFHLRTIRKSRAKSKNTSTRWDSSSNSDVVSRTPIHRLVLESSMAINIRSKTGSSIATSRCCNKWPIWRGNWPIKRPKSKSFKRITTTSSWRTPVCWTRWMKCASKFVNIRQ